MQTKLSKIESELMSLRRQKPFVAFAMRFKNGDIFKVLQPLQFAFAHGADRGVFLHPKEGIVRFRLSEIDRLQVKGMRRR